MYVQLDRENIKLLCDLVGSRIQEIHPEIRHTQDSQFRDNLKEELYALQRLMHCLHEAECDVMA